MGHGATNCDELANAADIVAQAKARAIPTRGSFLYLLLRDGVVVYVGRTKHIATRIAEHQAHRSKKFDAFSVLNCPSESQSRLELLLIRELRPEYNVQGNAR